jgi:hypothetical protein
LRERVAVAAAIADPGAGTKILPSIGDPRWSEPGWVKMQQVLDPSATMKGVSPGQIGGGGSWGLDPILAGDRITIHYLLNEVTGEIDDFKIMVPRS